jgi:NagD protein
MYFIDVQGTLIDDADRLPVRGAAAFIEELNAEGTPYMVITNNTKRSSAEFHAYLQEIGLEIPRERYLDPLMTLESTLPKAGVAAYGSEPFLRVIEAMGYRLEYDTPQSVLVAVKEDFDAEEYARMIDFLLKGARLVGMHETTLYAKNGRRYPGVGAVLKMLEFATSASYDVVGKPSRAFYGEALRRLREQVPGAAFEAVTIISDDVKGDLIGAKALGMKTVFVLSGKYADAGEIIPHLAADQHPDLICADMQEYREKR